VCEPLSGFDAGAAFGEDGKFVSISTGKEANFVRHCNYLFYVTRVGNQQDERDSTFSRKPGLAGPQFVSYESINFPSYFFSYDRSSGRLKLVQVGISHIFMSLSLSLPLSLPPSLCFFLF